MKVLKFGGASLSSKNGALEKVIKIATTYFQQTGPSLIVVSAFHNVTEKLISTICLAASGDESFRNILKEIKTQHTDEIAHLFSDQTKHRNTIVNQLVQLESLLDGVFLTRDITVKTKDLILSFGEQMSALTLADILSQHIPATSCDARKIIRTNSSYGQAQVDEKVSFGLIFKEFHDLVATTIIPGFIGANKNGETTTFGRGSSDYTAALIAAATKSCELEIWTPVSGFMTADPQRVSKALLIPQLEYQEAIELTYFGATILHPLAVKQAARNNIEIILKNTFSPESSGTLITKNVSTTQPIAGITSMSSVALIRIQSVGMDLTSELAKRIFSALAASKVDVLQISQGCAQHSLCIAIKQAQKEIAVTSLETEFHHDISSHMIDNIETEENCAAVAIVGSSMRSVAGTSGRFFATLGRNGINVITIAQGSSERVISVVIKEKDEKKALNAVHDSFFLSELKTLNLFMIGVGSVGSKLLEQLNTHQKEIREKHNVDLRLVGLANSSSMIIDELGIKPDHWKNAIQSSSQPSTIKAFVTAMKEANLSNSVFIDCTANQEVADCYENILSASISVVTPNKRANAGSFQQYCALRTAAIRGNVKYYYETNVGAGLPVIGTLQDLIKSGDSILKIEAVLSGTLSYIFNSYDGSMPFSQVVRQAKEKGFTEPDPRDDLSGADVARKLLILGREMGLVLEEKDISVESLIPKNCKAESSIAEFLDELALADDSFDSSLREAQSQNCALRYIGQIENGKAFVKLSKVDSNHPFYSLSGSDNVISFVTSRYLERPLVVKGPGAGTEVTAAGVMADILRIASVLD